MSFRRTKKSAGFCNPNRLPKGPHGRSLCRQCGTEVEPPRRTFCSDECVHEWRLRTSPQYVRLCLFQRDHGICQKCGVDTVTAAKEHLKKRLAWEGTPQYRELSVLQRFAYHKAKNEWIRIQKEQFGNRSTQSAWDADHILSVVEGGGECDLKNYQTLCCLCHKAKTAELARRRAEGKKLVVTKKPRRRKTK